MPWISRERELNLKFWKVEKEVSNKLNHNYVWTKWTLYFCYKLWLTVCEYLRSDFSPISFSFNGTVLESSDTKIHRSRSRFIVQLFNSWEGSFASNFSLQMEPLVTARRILTWLSMYPAEKSSNKWKRIVYTAFSLILVVCALCEFVSLLTFILKYISINFEECLFTLVVCIAFINIIYAMITSFFSRHLIPSIFEELTLIHEASELCDWSNYIYTAFRLKILRFILNSNADFSTVATDDFLCQADKLCEFIWTVYFKLQIIYIVSVTSAVCASILSCWLIYGHLDVDNLFHILNMR